MESDDEAIFVLNCMEAPIDEETKLLKELELLTACAISDDSAMVFTAINAANLAIPDPKTQKILTECHLKMHNGLIMQPLWKSTA